MRVRLLLPLALGLAAAVPVAAQDYPPPDGYAQSGYDTDGQSVDSISVFFEPLSRYGRWVDSRFGRGWTPNVNRDWRPYTIGHWEQGAYGQTWRSDEPFGWAVFHFGRWGFDPAIGWVWTPDTVWGPGWVAWRDSDDVTGWAPLPPRVALNFDAGYGDGFNNWGYDQWYQPSWVYVPRGYLYGRSLRGVILPYGRNRDFWAQTRGITRYDRVGGRVFNRSFQGDRGGDRGRGDPRGGDFRGGDRGRDFRGNPGGEQVIQGGGRRVDVRPQGTIGGDVRGYQGAPRRDGRPPDAVPGASVPSNAPPRDGRGGYQPRGGFVPFQPQGGDGRRAPVAIAPAGTIAPRQQPAPIAQPRPEAPRAAPQPRPAPARPTSVREGGENVRPQ
ncbi:MAG: DUF6600 domain-containing protein [Janthinobacterium lividum]